MSLEEVGKLLAIIASFDNRRLEASTAVAWKMMLDREVPGASLEQATEVVMTWFSTANPYFEVRHLCDGLRREMRLDRGQILADVRSAKARGIVGKDWPANRPLESGAVAMLAAARYRGQVEVKALSGESGPNDNPLGLEVGRAVWC